jgi:hypothetical protein
MSYTIYAAKFEQTIIHQHVHLRRESQSHEPAHVLMRLYPIDKSLFIYKAKEGRHDRASIDINYRLPIKAYYRICTLRHIRIEIIHGSQSVL